MNNILNDYLEKIDRYLKPLPVSERIDIVKEIKSQMAELDAKRITPEAILARLGDPKVLAKAYLGEVIQKTPPFSWKKLCSMAAFWGLAGTAWVFVLPVTSILGLSLMGSGVLIPLCGIVKFTAHFFGIDIPQIQFVIGSFSATAVSILPISIIGGILFYVTGFLLWKLTLSIIKWLNKTNTVFRNN